MVGTLLKKELSQIKKMYLTNKRKGTRGGKGLFIFLIICYVILMLSMGALESLFAFELIPGGYGWLYYFFVTVLAFLIGVLGSVFTTAEMLFRAKDNELLMAMPIPPAKIIFVRMVSVYIMSLIYELMVLFPGLILYWLIGGITVLNVLFGIIGIVLLGFIILAFSCFFGWIVAIITAKLKNKHLLTVFISVIFIGVFIYFRFKANTFFRNLVEDAQAIGESLRGWGYPLYAPGLGMTGNVPAMLVFAAIAGVLFAVTYILISRSFMKILNIKPTEQKAVFTESQVRTQSADRALLGKEFRRFLSSPNYMLNCGLGILFLIAGAILAVITSGQIRTMLSGIDDMIPNGSRMIPVLVTFGVCILAGFIDISAPSISLEGPYIWILQTMPVSGMHVLRAKFRLAALLTCIPAALCAIVVFVVAKVNILNAVMGLLCTLSLVILMILFGLLNDLKKPFLDWTNEVQAVKQNMNVLFPLLLGMLGPVVPAGLYLLLAPAIPPALYLAIWTVIFAALSFLIVRWFKRNGDERFAHLGQ